MRLASQASKAAALLAQHREERPMSRCDKLDEAHTRLAEAVDALVTGDDWRRFLQVARRFHAYSITTCC